jgi:hypothetical protein
MSPGPNRPGRLSDEEGAEVPSNVSRSGHRLGHLGDRPSRFCGTLRTLLTGKVPWSILLMIRITYDVSILGDAAAFE